ncbi:uncharacterized protein LOC117100916 [Anneissia japonica]|uniref:uncharacterized protein LOC117100916 n=1 Tax=Anneissia japonica TaxID=1529436 RepID=UPI001425ACEE|nr:uncharacterized protein LOC117100916 [Anneissia japonica]
MQSNVRDSDVNTSVMSSESAASRIADAINDAKCLRLSENDQVLLSNMIQDYFDDPIEDENDTDTEDEDEQSSNESDDDAGQAEDGDDNVDDDDHPDVNIQDEIWEEEGDESYMVGDLAGDNFLRNSGFNCSMSESDEKEMENIRTKKCRCRKPYAGMGCSHKFLDEWIFQVRCQINALTPDQKCMFLLGKISSGGVRTSELTESSKKINKNRKRGRTSIGYFVDGLKVCRDVFCFIHMMSDKTLTALVKHYLSNGIELKTKRSGGCGNNTRKFSGEDHKRAVEFITGYAEVHALVIPGRVPGFKSADPRTRLLPCNVTKAKVWRLYKKALQEMTSPDGKEYHVLGRSSFYNSWNAYCPYVRTTKPRTDLCWTCQKNNRKVYQSANQTLAEKQQLLKDQEEHLRVVQQERKLYQLESADAKVSVDQDPADLGKHDQCSRQGAMHYSFDYAQQVFFPNDPEQPGPTFFLTARKCGVFGVHCEGVTKQVNFLIDESVTTGKGSNSVVSFMDHYFDHYGLG